MPWLPHRYVLREKCDEGHFVGFVSYIREHDEQRKFGKRTISHLHLDGFSYWTMGQTDPGNNDYQSG